MGRNGKFFRHVFLCGVVSAACLLGGCIGIDVSEVKVAHMEQFSLSDIRGQRRVGLGHSEYRIKTKSDVLDKWGKPDKVKQQGGLDVLVYKKDSYWKGSFVWLLIPIPLALPIGRENVYLYFDNDEFVYAEEEYASRRWLVYCGLESSGSMRFICKV